MGIHPYQGVADEAPEAPDNGTIWRLNHLPALINTMAKYGEGAKQIWFTEFGWRAHVTLTSDGNWQRGVSPATQADYLARTITLVRTTYPTVTRLYWYKDRADSANPNEAQYGLIYPDGTPAPALKNLPATLRTGTQTGTGAAAAAVFVPIAPGRVYDSRWSVTSGVTVGPIAATANPADNVRQVAVGDARGTDGALLRTDMVPAGASAIAYNITVTGTQGAEGNSTEIFDGTVKIRACVREPGERAKVAVESAEHDRAVDGHSELVLAAIARDLGGRAANDRRDPVQRWVMARKAAVLRWKDQRIEVPL